MSRSVVVVGLLFVTLVCVGGCAPSGNPLEDTDATTWCCTALGENSAGFWLGVWHGFSAPVMLLISFFSSTVGVYETHNNGGWYNTGFLLGLFMMLGGFAGGGGYYNRQDR